MNTIYSITQRISRFLLQLSSVIWITSVAGIIGISNSAHAQNLGGIHTCYAGTKKGYGLDGNNSTIPLTNCADWLRKEAAVVSHNYANFNNEKITSLANGANNKDAINVSHLKDTLTALTGGASLKTNGTVKVPSYKVGDKAYNNAGNALANFPLGASPDNPYLKTSPLNPPRNVLAPGHAYVGLQDPNRKNPCFNSDRGAALYSCTNWDANLTKLLGGQFAYSTGENLGQLGGTWAGIASSGLWFGAVKTENGTLRFPNSVTVSAAGIKIEGKGINIHSDSNLISFSNGRLINVAGGTDLTDGVNVSQLKGALTGLGGGAGIDDKGDVIAPSYTIDDKKDDNVGDAITHLNEKIAKAGGNLVKQDPESRDITVARDLDGKQVDFTGKDADQQAANRVLTGVADGVNNNDAVTINQLKKAHIVDKLGEIEEVVIYDDPLENNVTFGGQGGTQLHNIADGTGDMDAVNIRQLKAAGLTGPDGNILNAVVYNNTAKDQVAFGGANGTVLANVAKGDVSAGSLQAVNGGQLFALQQQVSALDDRVKGTEQSISDLNDRVGDGRGGNNGGGNNGDNGSFSDGKNADASGDQSTALGQDALASGKDSTATGHGSKATGDQSTANGQGALASGTNSKADGQNAQATGENSTALGQGALASGKNSTTTGQGSKATGESSTANGQGSIASGLNSKADGQNARATGDNSTAIGQNALASGKDSTALGQNSSATGAGSLALGQNAKAPAANAVALGKDSVADRDNTVSIGSAGHERVIANVAAGTQGTDAVNVNQLNQGLNNTLAQARQYTDEKFSESQRDSEAGSASAIAIAGLPQATTAGRSMVAIASGIYQGEGAVALGVSAVTEDNSWVFKLSGTANFRGTVGGVVGAGYQW